MITHAVFDVDGVFTDGKFIYDSETKVFKAFGAHDSDAIKFLKFNNIEVQAITADKRGYAISKARMSDMGITLTLVSEKSRLNFVCSNVPIETTMFMGDGLHDAPLLRKAKIGVCPKNGTARAKASADYVTQCMGGNGAVLEAVEWLSENGLVPKTMESYLNV